jgi:hypothetical protein
LCVKSRLEDRYVPIDTASALGSLQRFFAIAVYSLSILENLSCLSPVGTRLVAFDFVPRKSHCIDGLEVLHACSVNADGFVVEHIEPLYRVIEMTG